MAAVPFWNDGAVNAGSVNRVGKFSDRQFTSFPGRRLDGISGVRMCTYVMSSFLPVKKMTRERERQSSKEVGALSDAHAMGANSYSVDPHRISYWEITRPTVYYLTISKISIFASSMVASFDCGMGGVRMTCLGTAA